MPTPKFRHALAHSYRRSHGAGRSPRALQCLKASWPATTWQIAGAKGRSRSFTTTQRTAKGLADETKKHLNKQGATEAIYEACSVEELACFFQPIGSGRIDRVRHAKTVGTADSAAKDTGRERTCRGSNSCYKAARAGAAEFCERESKASETRARPIGNTSFNSAVALTFSSS